MSEPIKLYDKDGNEVVRYSPMMAHLEVAAGLLFAAPPVDADFPALDGMPQDDEQATPKRGRPRKATGQIL